MLLAASEGLAWRYEVCEHAQGYLVQMRDVATGEVDEAFATVFRTMPVAFAFAEMSAAFDRFAAGEDEATDPGAGTEAETSERRFTAISDRLGDGGVAQAVLRSWETRRTDGSRRSVH